ncbi:MAG: alpha/beta hydrolase [Vulcanimicrobiota bacterium]
MSSSIIGTWPKLAKRLAILCALAVSIAAQPRPQPPPPQGAVGEEEGPVVKNVGLSQVRFPVICATNRKWVNNAYSTLDRATAEEPEFVLKYCTLDKSTHRLGDRSDAVFDKVLGKQPELDALLAPAPPGQVKRYLVYVHGFTSNFDQSFASLAQLAFDINRHSAPVLFSWPSGGNVAADYVAAKGNTRESGYKLAKTLEILQNRANAPIEVDLVCHSLGSEVVMDGLQELDTSRFQALQGKIRFKNIVFIAPDIAELDFKRDTQWPVFGSTRTTLYTNAKDIILATPSAAVNYLERVGLKTDFFDPRVQNVDVTPLYLLPSADAHTSVLNQPMGLMDLYLLLKYDLGASERNLYYLKNHWQIRR